MGPVLRATAVLVLALLSVSCAYAASTPGSGRPPPYMRKFVAPVIDQLIANLSSQIKVSAFHLSTY